MKDKTIWTVVLIAAAIYAVMRILPALTSRLTPQSPGGQSGGSYDVGNYNSYQQWMRPTIPYPGDYSYNDYYRSGDNWKNVLAQAGAGAGLAAASYYWPTSYPPAYGAPDQFDGSYS